MYRARGDRFLGHGFPIDAHPLCAYIRRPRPKQFTHGNAESAANGQQAFESPPKLGGGILFLRQSSENLGVYCRKYYARVRIDDQRFL